MPIQFTPSERKCNRPCMRAKYGRFSISSWDEGGLVLQRTFREPEHRRSGDDDDGWRRQQISLFADELAGLHELVAAMLQSVVTVEHRDDAQASDDSAFAEYPF